MTEHAGTREMRLVGDTIHTLMWRKRVSQARLARELGLSQSTVSKKLRGATAMTVAELFAIARVLDVEPGRLLDAGTQPDDVINADSLLPRLDSNQQPSGYPSLQVSRRLLPSCKHLRLVV